MWIKDKLQQRRGAGLESTNSWSCTESIKNWNVYTSNYKDKMPDTRQTNNRTVRQTDRLT